MPLESLVLGSPDAAEVAIPSGYLDEPMAELLGRYSDEAAFLADLLVFDAALQRAGGDRR